MIMKHLKGLSAENGFQRSLEKVRFRINQTEYIKDESAGNGGNRSFAHVTYCIAPNAGDTVLSQCVRRTFNTELKTSGWEIIPVTKEVSPETIRTINSCGMLVIGGGGLFLPDTNQNTISGWQWAISKELLEQIDVPICVYSVGYNYFRGQEANALFVDSLCALAEKSSFFGLRNMGSVNAVRELLPEEFAEKVVYQPCTTTLIRKLYAGRIPAKTDTGSVAVNMAFDRSALRFGGNQESVLNQVAEAVQMIENKGYRIFYVCHCWDDDIFLPYLKEKKVRYELVDLSRQYPETVFDFYNRMDTVLGMRSHAQMIPFGLNCEIISLGTHDKMKWFLDDIDADDWYIDLTEDIDHISERIVNVFHQIHEKEREITKKRLKEAQESLWAITKRNLEIIGGRLE